VVADLVAVLVADGVPVVEAASLLAMPKQCLLEQVSCHLLEKWLGITIKVTYPAGYDDALAVVGLVAAALAAVLVADGVPVVAADGLLAMPKQCLLEQVSCHLLEASYIPTYLR